MAIEILRGVKAAYEAHHKLKISDEAIQAAVRLSARYVPDSYLPDKAIDLIDESASRVRMYKSPQSINLQRAFRELRQIQKMREDLYAEGRYEEATQMRERERELVEQIEQLRTQFDPNTEGAVVTADDIAEVVAMWTGIPVKRIAATESERLIHLEDELRKARRRPRRGDHNHRQGCSPRTRRFERPQTANGFFHLPGANWRGQDGAD
jgi:ATP-dependent Clp protease ATP-binding subunit ClpC